MKPSELLMYKAVCPHTKEMMISCECDVCKGAMEQARQYIAAQDGDRRERNRKKRERRRRRKKERSN